MGDFCLFLFNLKTNFNQILIMKMTNIKFIGILTDAIEAAGVDIAPSYKEYAKVAYAIASDCGEPGRPYFHRICQLYTGKRDPKERDRIYTTALANTHHEVHLGTVRYLAEQAGVDRDALQRRLLEAGCLGEGPSPKGQKGSESACARDLIGTRGQEDDIDDLSGDANGEGPRLPGADPSQALPCLDKGYAWPGLIAEALNFLTRPEARDVLLLGLLTCVGAALGKLLRFYYSLQFYFPNLMTFVVAPPASGKSVLTLAQELVEPIHDDMRQATERDLQRYEREMTAYNKLSNEQREQRDRPKRPAERMFFITGNNTGTGLLQNLIENHGQGIIFEPEADTLTNAIKAEYGGFSDMLRNSFDHGRLSYNRRTEHEYRECPYSNLSVVLSGTPAQVAPLIPSAENGLHSRMLFYYLQRNVDWEPQFGKEKRFVREEFKRLGKVFSRWHDSVMAQGTFTFELTTDQQDQFNRVFSEKNRMSHRMDGGEMDAFLRRLAINLLRMMSIVALLRATEGTVDWSGQAPSTTPLLQCNPALLSFDSDAVQDGHSQGQSYILYITQDDFEAMLAMVEPLFSHSQHILSMLSGQSVNRRPSYEKSDVFASLDDEFTTEQMAAEAERRDISRSVYRHWIGSWKKNGLIELNGSRGYYRKLHV